MFSTGLACGQLSIASGPFCSWIYDPKQAFSFVCLVEEPGSRVLLFSSLNGTEADVGRQQVLNINWNLSSDAGRGFESESHCVSHCRSLGNARAWPSQSSGKQQVFGSHAAAPAPSSSVTASGASSQCCLGFALGAAGRKVVVKSRDTVSSRPPATSHIPLSALIEEPGGRGDLGGW